jgi:hypothetical protein
VSQPEAKRELSGLTLTREASEEDQEGGARNSVAADFAEALQSSYEHGGKLVAISGGPINKTQGCGAGAGRSRNFWLEPELEPVY